MSLRVIDGLWAKVAGFAAFVAVMAGVPAGGRAYAAGDVNRPGCPVASESSPGFRASLPDCRAYELVSEPNSDDTSNVVSSDGFPDGVHVFYESFVPTPAAGVGSGLSEQFLATRTSSGWVQRPISAPQGEGSSQLAVSAQGKNAKGLVLTADFSEAFLDSPFRDPFEVPQLNQATGMGVYKLSLASGVVSMLSLPDSGVVTQEMLEGSGVYAGFAEANDWGSFLVGGSADGSRVFFKTTAKLVTAPGTPQDTHEASNEVYERKGGHTYLVGVLPDGSVPVCGVEVNPGVGSTVGSQVFYSYGAVAPSGANVVFNSPGSLAFGAKEPCNEGGLFLRDVVAGKTVSLPGSQFAGRAGTGPGEEEKIFTYGASGLDEYHVTTGQTVEVGEGALLAYTPDGARVYYLGPEEGIFLFEEGKPLMRIPGTEEGGYKLSEGATSGGGEIHPGSFGFGETANMPVSTPDGSDLLFIDTAKLTEYDNCPEVKGNRVCHHEAYIYDAKANKVTCISCNPASMPEGQAQLVDFSNLDVGEQAYQNPWVPFISNDGSRAVFETTEALVPQDVNGTEDVYEWERAETNGCEAPSATKAASPAYSAVIEGCIYMLSSGLGQEIPSEEHQITNGTHLIAASENLQDVYIQTSESLLPGLDNTSKLYDVRVEGGFPYTRPPSFGCEPEQCKPQVASVALLGEPVVAGGAGSRKSTSGGINPKRHKLERALRICRHKKSGRRRMRCERVAHRRFGGAVRGVGSRLGGGR